MFYPSAYSAFTISTDLSNASFHNSLALVQQSNKELRSAIMSKTFLFTCSLLSVARFPFFVSVVVLFGLISTHGTVNEPLPPSKTATFKLTNGLQRLVLRVMQLL